MNHARAVLMAIDGTLLDSAEAQTRSWLRVLQDFGYDVAYGQVRARIGMGQDRLLRELAGIPEASTRARRILSARERLLRADYLPKMRTFEGVHALLGRVRASGARLAVVSSAPRWEALALLGRGQLLTDFDHVLCKDDAPRSTPAPDVVRAALERMGIRPDQAVMVASSPYDLAAAHAAQVPCIALKSAGWPESTLLDALNIYEHAQHLLTQFEYSPLASPSAELSAPLPFVWRDAASSVSQPSAARRVSRPSRPHAA